MKKMIAITGGIGSGKSTALHIFEKMGYPVFSCDEIYREVIQSPSYIEEISQNFPECIIDGKIEKKRLSEIVFKNKEKLLILNNIAHPLIMECLLKNMQDCQHTVVFAEVPLLFEGNFETLFNEVIVIMRNKEQRILSIMRRDNISRVEAISRIATQFDYDNASERFKNCNAIVLQNNGSPEDLKEKIQALNF
jgi:dephospho-CoA kinase